MQTVLITVVLTLMVSVLAHAGSPGFDIATKKKEDRVLATVADGKTVFTVQSRSGIGSATVTRTKERWPESVIVRLHLGGLESFAVSNGKITLMTSVASHSGRAKRLHVDEDGIDSEVEKGSPYWTEVKVMGADGKPSTDYPLKDGYFEIALPMAILRDQPKTITLSWIDFYRR